MNQPPQNPRLDTHHIRAPEVGHADQRVSTAEPDGLAGAGSQPRSQRCGRRVDPFQAGASSGARMSVCAGRSVRPTGQVTPLGPWLQ